MPPRRFVVTVRSIRTRVRGQVDRRRRNPLFDADWYVRSNPDVAVSNMDPYRHYRRFGATEGRDPSPFLDRDWYLLTNPDVAASGMDPIDHYYYVGARDGRDPCLSFHTTCYLTMHPDVRLSGMNPLLHYQQHGIREGRLLCTVWHGSALDLTPRQRYGDLLDAALDTKTIHGDVLWFGIIDWEYRVQRPQHLAAAMASAGRRVIYVAPHFDPADGRGAFTITSNPHPGVFQVRLKVSPPIPSLYEGLDVHGERQAIAAIRECAAELAVRQPISVLDFPAWRSLGMAVPGSTVIMDCLDHVAGFSNVSARVVAEEARLVAQADLVIASSQRLADRLGQIRPTTLIRNGADTGFFGAPPGRAPFSKTKPIVGYFGAIAEWFEIGWIAHAARAHPDWDFVLIGQVEGCRVDSVQRLDNVHLLGERPYTDLPSYLHQFDAAIIPFEVTELIKNTNPVKVYEYLSAGVPVIASPMPELISLGELVYLADGPESFVGQVERALAEDDEGRRAVRREWARSHDWTARGDAFRRAVVGAFPRVSVVVLCYNNWRDTQACLSSIQALSEYPDDLLEIIVVDNASEDATAEGLEAMRQGDTRVRVISNDSNLGFAGGNNIGIRQATGDVIILLNNDTHVTKGWIRRLIRPLMQDGRVGLSGPLTNNIGNEQKVALRYDTMEEMQRLALQFTDDRLGETCPTDNLAFFCVALRRDVVDDVGLLDEGFGLGFFEDDDYCRRAATKGWRMVIADDAFVHHKLSASFDALGAETRRELFERNKQIFETKWGPWRPHRYRDAAGFGA
jgi:GT2 family glycosyltransferase/glycosyltransferase involved in cell wall biosynthesis